jgi:mannitol/fructose-specific phosphotransferase system IIA component (Ntr-type)
MQLERLLIKSAIRAKLSLETREEIIQKAGDMLVEAGAIKPEYIQAMKKGIDELGPYCVIAPGITLLHARPEDGVERACLSLLTLRNPVKFGHSTNDPVDVVFALGAKDKNDHIEALAELAGFLAKEDFLQVLRNSEDSHTLQEKIFEYIKTRK